HVGDTTPVVLGIGRTIQPNKADTASLLRLRDLPLLEMLFTQAIVAEAARKNRDAMPTSDQGPTQFKRPRREPVRSLGVVVKNPKCHPEREPTLGYFRRECQGRRPAVQRWSLFWGCCISFRHCSSDTIAVAFE